MRERSLRAAAREIIEGLYDRYDLVYVSQGDKFTDEQVGFLVAGDWESLWSDCEEWECDARAEAVHTVLKEAADEVFRRWEAEDGRPYEALRDKFDGSEEWEGVEEAILERDDSRWPQELANQTPDVLLRIRCIDADSAFSFEEVTPQQVLERVGLEATEENVATVQYALDNASPEWSVLMGYWLVGADVRALYDLPSDTKRVTITNPYLFLGNPFAGSGFATEDALQGVVTVNREDLRTDSGAFGYSVQVIYGGVDPSNFAAKIEAVQEVQ